MNILFLSKEGDGLGMAHQLVKEGHNVRFWIKDPKYRQSGVGIVERVSSWRPSVPWARLIVGDMVGFGRHKELLDGKGKAVIGIHPFLDAVELDREKGLELFRRGGVKIPRSWAFPGVAAAKAARWPRKNVFIKPSGNIATAKTMKCMDEESVEHALESFGKVQPFVIQEIVDGVEVSTEGWFNGRNWIEPFNHTFEEKRFLVGNLGPQTGCMGNIVMIADRDKIVEATLERLTPTFRKAGVVGPIDINCIVNESGIYAIEPTCRFGYDAVEALMEGLKENVADLLFETAIGTKNRMDLSDRYMIAVRLSVPPWPLSSTNGVEPGLPVKGLNSENLKHIFLTDVYKDDIFKVAMGDGVVLKATARSNQVREARRRVYRTLDGLSIADKQYRTDIGSRVEGDLAKLKGWGYI